MKKVLFLIFVLSFPLICLAQDATTQATLKQENKQVLQLTIKSDKQVYGVGEPILITYKITNTSDAPIIIANIPVVSDMYFYSNDSKKPKILTSDGYIPKKKEDYTILLPGQSRDLQGDLSKNQIIRDRIGSWNFKITQSYGFSDEAYPQAFKGGLASNPITIEVVEKKGIAKNVTASKIIKRSVGQGDYVRDERSSQEACKTILQSIYDDNSGLDCKLIDSERIDHPKDFNKCVDGATMGGCFACTFECS